MVIDGGIRDLARLQEIPDFSIFCRGVDPSAIADVTLAALNGPVRIGGATVLPGDVVLGTCSGRDLHPAAPGRRRWWRPPSCVRLQDQWGQMRLREGKYLPGQVDGNWTEEMRADFNAWRRVRASPGLRPPSP